LEESDTNNHPIEEGFVEGMPEGASEGMKEGASDGMLDGTSEGTVEGPYDGINEGKSLGSIESISVTPSWLCGASVGVVVPSASGARVGALLKNPIEATPSVSSTGALVVVAVTAVVNIL
jgi:hypothetical protein